MVLEGDGLEVLSAWGRGCVDAVVTDPPWNLGKDYGPHDDGMPRDGHVPRADLAAVGNARDPRCAARVRRRLRG